ncbi:ABC transporter substrate-binding protein [Limnohabitans sp.]|uniref:ABC transporter substrate-binding protein n=1 Tax=Limnohabitans sp. TaxID=1907725 RepID=UPI0025BCF629|nr:ABC transporter substrate-binding protein [Limnohabitans sp.]
MAKHLVTPFEALHGRLQRQALALAFILCACCAQAFAQTPAQTQHAPVWIGFDDAYGLKTNTSAIATEWGIKAAIEEINNKGGVLNGRPLKLITTDNKGVSARGKDNFVQLAGTKDLVAVLSGKFSPISVEMLPDAHRLKVPLISVWGSADPITDHAHKPSYSFRVSLKDDWGVEAMMRRLSTKYKVRQACAILPNTAWGRSAEKVIQEKSRSNTAQFPVVRWYNWGDASLKEHYKACLDSRTQGLLFVGNEKEGALLVKEIAAQAPPMRMPVVAHWGAVGGTLHELVNEELSMVNIDFIQTFTFINNKRPRAVYLADWILKNNGLNSTHDIPSPVGAAHAYDTVHLLAKAIDTAKTTSPEKIRDALEKLPPFQGAVRHYTQPFTPQRHDALDKSQVLFVKLTPSGQLIPQD